MEPLISIIVPVYNTGELLKYTVKSILEQNYRNIELIIIDDGSDEATYNICEECKAFDKRVVVYHKSNGGICNARNYGLMVAKGEFITFSDHDDCVDQNILKTEYELVCKYNADIAIVGKKTFYDNKVEVEGNNFVYKGKEIQNNICSLISSRSIENIWNVLYKKSIVGGLSFDESFKRGQEDINFNLEVIKKCNVIASVENPLYIHIVRENMSVSSGLHLELMNAFIKTNNHAYLVVNEMTDNLDKQNREYVNMQGERLRFCLAYLVKMGAKYSEFIKVINQLEYYEIDEKSLSGLMNKNAIVYTLVLKKKWRLLFCILKLYQCSALQLRIIKNNNKLWRSI